MLHVLCVEHPLFPLHNQHRSLPLSPNSSHLLGILCRSALTPKWPRVKFTRGASVLNFWRINDLKPRSMGLGIWKMLMDLPRFYAELISKNLWCSTGSDSQFRKICKLCWSFFWIIFNRGVKCASRCKTGFRTSGTLIPCTLFDSFLRLGLMLRNNQSCGLMKCYQSIIGTSHHLLFGILILQLR